MHQFKNKLPVYLASASPQRKLLLQQTGISFEIKPSHITERVPPKINPVKNTSTAQIAISLAVKKAQATAKKITRGLILGADTIVVLGDYILGKPGTSVQARKMLNLLNGTIHQVYTGVAVVKKPGNKIVTGYAVTQVKMKHLTSDTIKSLSTLYLDKAGGYAIQERGDRFIAWIKGDYDNVVGLPIKVVICLFKRLGYIF